MKLTLRKIPAIGLVALVAINLVLAFGAMVPLAVSFKRNVGEIKVRRAELEAHSAAPRAIKTPSALIAEIPSLRALAIEEESELPFITAIEDLAAAHALVIDLRLVPPPAGSAGFGYDRLLGVEISLKGDARNVGKFIEALEARDAILSVRTFSVSAAPDAPGAVRAQFSGTAAWPETQKKL